jgi:hypothetical protein
MALLEDYWGSLFTLRPVSTSEMHLLLHHTSWSSLQKDISQQEVEAALAKPKPGSSPGPDGLPYEFYRAFPQIMPKLTALLNWCYQHSVMPLSWKTALLHPLPKEGKDATLVANYRPIALMCTDYKLLTSVLAARLQHEILRKNYFPAHQTGFIKGRSIYEPILRVASWAASDRDTVCLLDFEKAYDRVQHQWLFSCLSAAGLPRMFISFLQEAFRGATIRVVANGSLSRHLLVTSGVRQGDPLSPLLFNFAIEPLLLALEKAGAKVQGHADDTALGLSTQAIASRASSVLTEYEKASGMLLNRGKSVVLACNTSWAIKVMGFKAAPEGDRYLGLHLDGKGSITVLPATWEKLEGKLNTMARIPTSLFGRMTLLRTYIRPALLYQLVVAKFTELETWCKLEQRFLNSSDSTLSQSERAMVAESRLHPLNWGRLPPIMWEIDKRRLGLLATRGSHLGGKWSWLSPLPAEITEGSQRHTPFEALRASLLRYAEALGLQLISSKWRPVQIIIPEDSPILTDKALAITTALTWKQEKQLVLTPAQQRWSIHYNTDWPSLWETINRTTKRLRSPIAAFIWRLLNMCLPWATQQSCPLCSHHRSSATHLFLDCPGTTDLFTPIPLEAILTPPHISISKDLILALWAQWKLITWVKHKGIPPGGFDRHKLASKFLDDEIERAQATGWYKV